MNELIQKKGLQRKHYKILDGKLYVNIKSTQEHNEWTCSLEELGLKKLYKKQPRIILNIAAAVCLTIVIAALLTFIFAPEQMEQRTLYFNTGIWGFLGVFFFLIPTKNEIYLYGGTQDLSFFRNKPDEKTVDQFVDEPHLAQVFRCWVFEWRDLCPHLTQGLAKRFLCFSCATLPSWFFAKLCQ